MMLLLLISQKDASKVFLRQRELSQPTLRVNYKVMEPTREDTFKLMKCLNVTENDFYRDLSQSGRLLFIDKDDSKILVLSFLTLQKILEVHLISLLSFHIVCIGENVKTCKFILSQHVHQERRKKERNYH